MTGAENDRSIRLFMHHGEQDLRANIFDIVARCCR